MDITVSREQYYLDLLTLEDNVLKKADSRLGLKHSPETIAKFKVRSAKQKEHLNRLHLDPEYIAKRSEQLNCLHLDPEFK